MKKIIVYSILVLLSVSDVGAMSVSLKSEVEGTKIRRIVGRHSSVDDIFSFCEKPILSEPICKIDYSVIPSNEKGDGVVIDVNGEELKLTWDYEDSYDYAPRPVVSTGNYAIVREDQFGKTSFSFVVVPKEKAEKLAYELIQKGEQDSFVSQQVGISREKIQDLREQRYPAHTKLYH